MNPLIPGLLAVYSHYLRYRAAHSKLPDDWQQVVQDLQIATFVGDQLAMMAARALAEQRAGLGSGAEELWLAVPHAVQIGVQSGLKTIADALIWTDEHEDPTPKDGEGIVPTQAEPPVELADVTAQAVASAAQSAAAESAGWRYKTWKSVQDTRVRSSHQALHGVKISLSEQFHTPSGAALAYPGDPDAPIEERIGCRCSLLTSR